MPKKCKITKTRKTKKVPVNCSIFSRQKLDIEKYIFELIDAKDDLNRNKWSWGIIMTLKPLVECRLFRKRVLLCQQCRSYAESKKRLAELVIIGLRT